LAFFYRENYLAIGREIVISKSLF